jgi:hypothetical protein
MTQLTLDIELNANSIERVDILAILTDENIKPNPS